MATSHSNSFQRVFPNRELYRGPARGAVLWSGLAAVCLVALLFDLYLLTDLLVTGGRVEVVGEQQAAAVAELTGRPVESLANGRNGWDAEDRLILEDQGLLPAVWWSQDRLWGRPLAAAYREIALLRQNGGALIVLTLLAVALYLLRMLFLSRAETLGGRVSSDAAMRLRRALHRQTLRLGPADVEDKESVRVRELFTQDVNRVREGIALWVKRCGRFPSLLVLLMVFALLIHWRVALLCLLPLAAGWILVQREKRLSKRIRDLAQDRADTELRLLEESFRKTRLIRGYGMETFEHEQFQKHLDRYREGEAAVERGERRSRWKTRLPILFFLTIVLFLPAGRVLQAPADLPLAAAVTLLATFACMYRPLEELGQLRSDRDAASRTADRIYRYLDQIPEVGQAVGAKFLQPLSRSLQFETVTYSLPHGPKLLNGLDLKLPAGEVAAVVSLDALEARAMAYLLPRFLEPQSGRVLFDGEDIAWVTLESLRAETIYVGGTDPFFTGSVLENIGCGNPDYSLQDITAAAKQTHAHNFILKLPQGYETILGAHGEQLDAGQSFRLGLARAVLRNPALMVIEEPSQPLDDDSKALLDDAYSRIVRDRTVIFLPTRLSTVRRADRIVVLHRGRVEAIGNHAELVKVSPLYRHWEYIRFNEFRHVLERAETASPHPA